MRHYSIEHIGILVTHPQAMAQWYHDVLGFHIHRTHENHEKGVAFITDHHKKVMLEFGKLPNISPLCERIDHHLQLHIALTSDDPEQDMQYLIEHGATFIEQCPVSRPGEILLVLHDPWGNCIQLVKRNHQDMVN